MEHLVHGDEHGIPRIKLKESVEAGQGQRTNTYKYLRMTFKEEGKLGICIKMKKGKQNKRKSDNRSIIASCQ